MCLSGSSYGLKADITFWTMHQAIHTTKTIARGHALGVGRNRQSVGGSNAYKYNGVVCMFVSIYVRINNMYLCI